MFFYWGALLQLKEPKSYLCKKSEAKKVVAITKHGVTHCVVVRPIKETEGFIPGLDTEDLRDETERTF